MTDIEQEQALRAVVARDATDAQWKFFCDFCTRRGLDPYTRQVHWTRQGVITGIDGFRALAERSGEYRPGETRYDVEDGKLLAAHVTVYRRYGDEWHPLSESAYLEEYKAASPLWVKMPRVMLAKVAEARALRRAFPSVFSGVYAAEEMDQAQKEEKTPPPAPAKVSKGAQGAQAFADGVIAELAACTTVEGVGAVLAAHEAKLHKLRDAYGTIHADVEEAIRIHTARCSEVA